MILITGINAPDGIMVDRKGNIWICSNQEDEIVVIDPHAKPNAKVIAKLGDFYGIDHNGIARGFCFRQVWLSATTARLFTYRT